MMTTTTTSYTQPGSSVARGRLFRALCLTVALAGLVGLCGVGVHRAAQGERADGLSFWPGMAPEERALNPGEVAYLADDPTGNAAFDRNKPAPDTMTPEQRATVEAVARKASIKQMERTVGHGWKAPASVK